MANYFFFRQRMYVYIREDNAMQMYHIYICNIVYDAVQVL